MAVHRHTKGIIGKAFAVVPVCLVGAKFIKLLSFIVLSLGFLLVVSGVTESMKQYLSPLIDIYPSYAIVTLSSILVT